MNRTAGFGAAAYYWRSSGRTGTRASAIKSAEACPLFGHGRSSRLDLRLHGIKIEARTPLHRRKLNRRHRQLLHLLLNKHEAPEFVFEPVEILLGAFFGPAIGPAGPLERIETKVDQIGYVRLGFVAQPASRLVDETILEVVDAHGTQFALSEVKDFVPVRRPLAGNHVHLVIAVQIALIGRVTDLFALLQLLCDVWIAGRRQEGRKPVQAGN